MENRRHPSVPAGPPGPGNRRDAGHQRQRRPDPPLPRARRPSKGALMTHATSEEIHDHAYGFRLSEHVAGCAECGRAVDAVAAERETLRDVLDEDPARAPAELLER